MLIISMLFLIPIAVVDYRKKIIPNKMLLLMFVVAFAFWIFKCFRGDSHNLSEEIISSICGFGVAGVIFMITYLISRGGVGAGDVKLFAILGLMNGVDDVFKLIVLTFVLFIIMIIMASVATKFKSGQLNISGGEVLLKKTFPLAPCILLSVICMIVNCHI